MSLIECPECKNKVSSEASVCPHCGKKRPGTNYLLGCSILILIVLIAFTCEKTGKSDRSSPSSQSQSSSAAGYPAIVEDGAIAITKSDIQKYGDCGDLMRCAAEIARRIPGVEKVMYVGISSQSTPGNLSLFVTCQYGSGTADVRNLRLTRDEILSQYSVIKSEVERLPKLKVEYI